MSRSLSHRVPSLVLGVLLLAALLCGCGGGDKKCFPECAPSLCQVCRDGQCVVSCRADQTCEAGVCTDVATCSPACDASACMACQNGSCQSTCTASEECVMGACVPVGSCNPPCDTDSCEVCDNGSCVSACDTDACMVCDLGSCVSACFAGQVCDGAGTCVDDNCNPACDTDQCLVCDNGSCVTRCGADQVCDGAGTCVTDTSCNPACDANACLVCDAGNCVSACQVGQVCDGAGTCVADTTCNPACDAGACLVCDNGSCVSSCTAGQICDNGSCVADTTCNPACDAGACLVCDNGSCVSSCTAGQICDNGSCVADTTCNPACDPGACETCDNGMCISTCQLGQICTNGSCVADTSCNPACDAAGCEVCVSGACEYSCAAVETCDGAGTCVGPASMTIYDIQEGNHVNSPAVGDMVTVTGVVVTAIDHYYTYQGGFWIQEVAGGQYSGIAVFNPQHLPITFVEGDVLTVTGQYLEFYGMSNLALQSYTVEGPGAVPAPAVVAPADLATASPATAEPWEGVLVEVQNVSVSDADLPYGMAEISGGLLLDDDLMDLSFLALNDAFSAIVGIHAYGFDEYKLLPRYLGDLYPGQGCFPTCDSFMCMECVNDACTFACSDAEVCQNSTCVPAGGLSIYDLQDPDSPNYPGVNVTVTLNGVIVTAIDTTGTDAGNFWIQDVQGGPYSGIMVYNGNNLPITFAVGDKLTVTGEYQEYYFESEISLASFSVDGSGASLSPAIIADPASIATNGTDGELYEGVLVQVRNLTVTNPDLGYGEFEVNGSLRVDDDLYLIQPTVVLNDTFGFITGILRYSYDDFKLEPRSAADVQ